MPGAVFLQLVLLLGLVGVTAFSLWRYGARPTCWRVCGGLLVIAVMWLAPVVLFRWPFSRVLWYVVPVCLGAVWMFQDRERSFTLSVLVGLWMIALFHLHALALWRDGHPPTVIANPNYHGGRLAHQRAYKFIGIRILLRRHADADIAYPAGWMSDHPLSQTKNPERWRAYFTHRAFTVQPAWYSLLTDVYAVRYTWHHLWYPGGRVEEAIDCLEYRPREKAPCDL